MRDLRDYRLYYVACPKGNDHFILEDPGDPTWEKTPPDTSVTVVCVLCGYKGNSAQTWKTGYVSSEERDRGVAYNEPYPLLEAAGDEHNQKR